ncbi:nitrilase-related carbon-nitrogen hydrolase [Paenibacillus sp. 1001270B_150601_E10]|uniref:nitrilase-related carbon-nitrogen hydrolase n=1 Tax=Paenibacillus sp. 1001270B_150601_E10 TaxID=2787079 RepID=UPI002B4BA777|nr:nitrilase-related carbon-nitrogen hydrolase [Paenibacillus sp. 1001270B_150601_E10]
MDEHLHLTEGESVNRFELDGIPCGSIICYDLRFPELTRTLALSGAQVLFVPAQWPNPRLYHWKTLLAARAIENQMAVVACNRMGSSIGDHGEVTSFFGHSMIIDPWGEVTASAADEEIILTGKINLEQIPDVRSRIPVFKDRKPHIYHLGAQANQ